MSAPLPVAFLDGEYLPAAEARVPALDRGFLYGDGVYEVIPVYAGRAFRLDAHLDRLERSLAAVRCRNPHERTEWAATLERLVERNGGGQMALYLQVTRGAEFGREHAFPAGATPRVFVMCLEMPGPSREALEHGVPAVVMPDERWGRCDIKAVALLANVLARQAAADLGGSEAILVRDGLVTEGASSSVMIVEAGAVVTPPDAPAILPGVTRDLLRELALEAGLPWEVRDISERQLRAAPEIWLSSSTREVLAVTRLDGAAVGDGRPGPVWRRMYALLQNHKAALAQQVA